MFLDVYINGEKRSTIHQNNEETVRLICAGTGEKPEFYPQGVSPQDIAEKLQSLRTMTPKNAPKPQGKKAAKTNL